MFSSIAPCLSNCLRTASKSVKAPPETCAPKSEYTLPLASTASKNPSVPLAVAVIAES